MRRVFQEGHKQGTFMSEWNKAMGFFKVNCVPLSLFLQIFKANTFILCSQVLLPTYFFLPPHYPGHP